MTAPGRFEIVLSPELRIPVAPPPTRCVCGSTDPQTRYVVYTIPGGEHECDAPFHGDQVAGGRR